MGNTRIQDMTRAQALREIKSKLDWAISLQHGRDGNPWPSAQRLFAEARQHKNYHVRVQAWKAQGAPMPKCETHEETLAATITLALELQPNQVARYFKQQDAELEETLSSIAGTESTGDMKRAKEFSDVMKQQFCVSLLYKLSGQGMVI